MAIKIGSSETAISYRSIMRVVAVFLAFFFVYLVRDVLALLFVSVIFAAAIDPWVDWLKKHKVPRAVSILIIYIVLIAVFSLIVVMLVPAMAEQIVQIVSNIPDYYEKISIGIHTLRERAGDSAINTI